MSLFSDFSAEDIYDLLEKGLSGQLEDFLNGFSLADLLSNEPSAEDLMNELKVLQTQLAQIDSELKDITTQIDWTTTEVLIKPTANIIVNAIRDFNNYADTAGPEVPPTYASWVQNQVGGSNTLPNALADFHSTIMSAAEGKSTYQIFMDRLVKKAQDAPTSASLISIGSSAASYVNQQFAFQIEGTSVLQSCYLDYDPPLVQDNAKAPGILAGNLKKQFKEYASTLPTLTVALNAGNSYSLTGKITNANASGKYLTAAMGTMNTSLSMSDAPAPVNTSQTFKLQQHIDGSFQITVVDAVMADGPAYVWWVKDGRISWWNNTFTFGFDKFPTDQTYWRLIPVEGAADTTYFICNQHSGQYLGTDPKGSKGDVLPYTSDEKVKMSSTKPLEWSFVADS